MDRSASDALRLTLDQVRIGDVPQERRPQRIRLSVHVPTGAIAPGQRIMTTGHLSPPQGPVEPGGFDFRRHAWFQRLGAVGYTRVPIMTIAPATEGTDGIRVTAIRMAISQRVRQILPGEIGGFAAAVTTGDRSGMGQEALSSLRASNLAHLLAISGLHMGLLTGFVFVACRLGLSLCPPWRCDFRFGRWLLFSRFVPQPFICCCPGQRCNRTGLCHGQRHAGGRIDRPTRDFTARGCCCRRNRAGSSARVAAEPRISNVLRRNHSLGRRLRSVARDGPDAWPKLAEARRRRGDVIGNCRPCNSPHRCRAFQYDVPLRSAGQPAFRSCHGSFCRALRRRCGASGPVWTGGNCPDRHGVGVALDPYGFGLGVAP